ncbi:ATP-dependent RNA helicase [Acrasis kona]|uniref:ATP-dependent RNA helicase n=1 Tax=Acrasis kona TaxID=1008807 RepID=A0AAW2Z3H4_9EUKA
MDFNTEDETHSGRRVLKAKRRILSGPIPHQVIKSNKKSLERNDQISTQQPAVVSPTEILQDSNFEDFLKKVDNLTVSANDATTSEINTVTPNNENVQETKKPTKKTKSVIKKELSTLSTDKGTVAPTHSYIQVNRSERTKVPFVKKTLPIEDYRQEIVDAVTNHRVTIITGYTGCGKSTQIPQYIYESSKFLRFKILCTQPRRLAAISLAERVSQERNEKVGRTNYNHYTSITFMTTGCLTEKILSSSQALSKFTHVIIDEVHERDVENDLLLNLMRYALQEHPTLRLILMSATIDPEKFTNYFSTTIPQIFVPSGCFPVTEHYLEDMLQILPANDESQLRSILNTPTTPNISKPRLEYVLDYIIHMHQSQPTSHSYLIFLPGISDIENLYGMLESRHTNNSMEIHVLHSIVNIEEQESIFDASPMHVRKIILATNIAESSITIPDCQVVIDFCLSKSTSWDPITQIKNLNLSWISKDSAQQRKGRSGRVSRGSLYRIVTKSHFESLHNTVTPQIQQEPLDSLILRILRNTKWDTPSKVLSECIDPPNLSNLHSAYEKLISMGAISHSHKSSQSDANEQLFKITNLGELLSCMPIDLNSSMLVIYGFAFGFLHECIALASIIARKSPIHIDRQYVIPTTRALLKYSNNSHSDLIASLRAYSVWQNESKSIRSSATMFQKRKWCAERWLHYKTLVEIDYTCKDIYRSMQRYRFTSNESLRTIRELQQGDETILKCLLCAAFSKNMLIGKQINPKKSQMATIPPSMDPLNSIIVNNGPGVAPLDHSSLAFFFENIQGGCGSVKSIKNSKKNNSSSVYVEFCPNESDPSDHSSVLLATRFRKIKPFRFSTSFKKSMMISMLGDDFEVEHDLSFESVTVFPNVQVIVEPVFMLERSVKLSGSSVVCPLLKPPSSSNKELVSSGHHHFSEMVIIPVIFHGINNNSMFFASECTLLPPIHKFKDLVMILFSNHAEIKSKQQVEQLGVNYVIQKSGTCQSISMMLLEKYKDVVDDLREYIQSCVLFASVRKSQVDSNDDGNGVVDLSPFDLAKTELLCKVLLSSDKAVVPMLNESIEILQVPDHAYKHVIGRSRTNIDLIKMASGARISVDHHDKTVTIRYYQKKQMQIAKRMIQQAILNAVVVFNHPEEAHLVLEVPESSGMLPEVANVVYIKTIDPKGTDKIFYTLACVPGAHSYDNFSAFNCVDPECFVDDPTLSRNLVKSSLIRYQSPLVHKTMFHRLSSLMANVLSRVDDVSTPHGFLKAHETKFNVSCHLGRQFFYPPKTQRTLIIPYADHDSYGDFRTTTPLALFLRYSIGHGRDIKTLFSDDAHHALSRVVNRLEKDWVVRKYGHGVLQVSINMVDSKKQKRFDIQIKIENEQIIFERLKQESEKHAFLSFVQIPNANSNVLSDTVDYSLKLSSYRGTTSINNVGRGIRKVVNALRWDSSKGVYFDVKTLPQDRFLFGTISYRTRTEYINFAYPNVVVCIDNVREDSLDAVDITKIQFKDETELSSLNKDNLAIHFNLLLEKVKTFVK